MSKRSRDWHHLPGIACLPAFAADCTAARSELDGRAHPGLVVELAYGLAEAHIPRCSEREAPAALP